MPELPIIYIVQLISSLLWIKCNFWTISFIDSTVIEAMSVCLCSKERKKHQYHRCHCWRVEFRVDQWRASIASILHRKLGVNRALAPTKPFEIPHKRLRWHNDNLDFFLRSRQSFWVKRRRPIVNVQWRRWKTSKSMSHDNNQLILCWNIQFDTV